MRVAFVLALAAPNVARRVFAWTHEDEALAADQLDQHRGLFDGVFVGYCGLHLEGEAAAPRLRVGPYYEVDRCRTITEKALALGLELHMWIDVQQSAKFLRGDASQVDVSQLAADIAEEAKRRNWTGVQIDDESEGCPRKDREQMKAWLHKTGELATKLHAHGLQLTAAVQGLSCSVCSPWPACLDQGHDLTWYAELSALLSQSPVDRWLEMDTYYGKLPYFYDNFDFYAQELFPQRPERWGVGILPNANPTTEEQTVARFHALEEAGVQEVDVFKLPLKGDAVSYFDHLQRWKDGRAGCAQHGVLGFWAKPCEHAAHEALITRREPLRRLRGL